MLLKNWDALNSWLRDTKKAEAILREMRLEKSGRRRRSFLNRMQHRYFFLLRAREREKLLSKLK